MTDHQYTAAEARQRAERLGRGVGHRSAAQERADDDYFDRGLAALRAYAGVHGNTRVANGYVDPDGFPLAVWVAGERIAHLEGDLPRERQDALEGVTGWQWEAARDRWHRTGEDRA